MLFSLLPHTMEAATPWAIHNNNLITGGNVSIDGEILPDRV